MPLLEVTGLTVSGTDSPDLILKGINLQIPAGKKTALVGESGAGKTILCRTLSGLLPDRLMIKSGRFMVSGRPASYGWIKKNRGSFVFYSPQNATDGLNPVLKIKSQLNDIPMNPALSIPRILEKIGFGDPDRILNSYPFELSGGENQRCVLAMALALSPRLLILDEPVTSLDVFLQGEFLSLVKDMVDEHRTSVLIVTHNLTVARNWSDHLLIMFRGGIVASGHFDEVLKHPEHCYTRELLNHFS